MKSKNELLMLRDKILEEIDTLISKFIVWPLDPNKPAELTKEDRIFIMACRDCQEIVKKCFKRFLEGD